MKVFKTLNKNPNLALALGFFDGVHLAHQKLILNTVEWAKKHNTKSAVITFSQKPSDYFSKTKTPNIMTLDDRLEHLDFLGVDFAYVLDFEKIMNLSAHDYVQKILYENFSPKSISVGYDHTFGAKRLGNSKLLKQMSKEFNFEFMELERQCVKNCIISSTNTRKLLSDGLVNEASMLLGRKFYIKNNVIKGSAIARKLGFPTANLNWPEGLIKLPYGVYLGYVVVDKTYPALINWGVRPSIDKKKREFVEAHIFNFNADIYGEIIKIAFCQKIRNEINFSSSNELVAQISRDVSQAKKLMRISNLF